MEFIYNKDFDEYIEKYKNLPLKEKKELVEKEFRDILVVMDTLNKNHGNESKILYNREILDLKKDNVTEEDFVEAMFLYVHSVKELFASLMNALDK